MQNFDVSATATLKAYLKFYVHVAEQLDKVEVEGLNRQNYKDVEIRLQKALNKIELVPSDLSPWNMEGLELTLRLVNSHARSYGTLFRFRPYFVSI